LFKGGLTTSRLTLELLEIDYETVCNKIEDFIRSYVEKFEKEGAIVGMSGGIDSSVTTTLCVRALGRDKVFGLIMPERDSEPQNMKDAEQLAKKLKIKYEVFNITPILRQIGVYDLLPDSALKNKKWLMEKLQDIIRVSTFEAKPTELPTLDAKSRRRAFCFVLPKTRVRSIMLHYYGCLKRLLVVGTLCKSEYLTSNYDEHGDGACEIAPLRNLYKTQVRQLGKYLKLPKSIIEKPSTPDFLLGFIFTDEAFMGINYEKLDTILYCLERGMKSDEIAKEVNIDESIVKRYESSIEIANMRRQMPFAPQI
jgi:NAD+ synthase